MKSGEEQRVQSAVNAEGGKQAKAHALEETRSFLDNLPQVKKPSASRSFLDEHLNFLNNLQKAPEEPPLKEPAVGSISLAGVREEPLAVTESTESPNKGTQKAKTVIRAAKTEQESALQDVQDEVDSMVEKADKVVGA